MRKRISIFLLLTLLASSFPGKTQAQTLMFSPVADSYVDASKVTTNFGTSSIIRTSVSPIQNSYLRFNVTGLGGKPISSVKLRLYANGSSSVGYQIKAVTDSSWGETAINYGNAPGMGVVVGSSGPHGGGVWTLTDLTPYVTGEGLVSIGITSMHTSARSYPSREAGANSPQLIVETDEVGPTATPVPTVVPTPTLVPIATNTPVPTATPVPTGVVTPTPTSLPTATLTPTVVPSPTPVISPTPTPTQPPSGTDLSDALLLYNSSKTNSDYGYEKVVRYYGLKQASVNISTTTLSDGLLRDEVGDYYKSVEIDATALQNGLSASEMAVLSNAIESGGVNLLVTEIRNNNATNLATLTGGEITGSNDIADSSKDYWVTGVAPEVTKEFSGKTIVHTSDPADWALRIGPGVGNTAVLVNGKDNGGQFYPIFARYKNGVGGVFVISNTTETYLRYNLLSENYTNRASDLDEANEVLTQQRFAQITPLLMFVKHTAGAEGWHNDKNYANFTLDDPPLVQQSGSAGAGFDYLGILQQAQAHNFHFTLGLPPGRADSASERETQVIDAFINNPDYMSVNIHGNNHDGYEFYKYSTTSGDPYPARPYADQVADIDQGLSRMAALTGETGLPISYSMIFPYNISPTQTLAYLKQKNFQMTVNSTDVPLGETRTRTWDAYMYPAELEYGNFPVVIRYHGQSSTYVFDMFLDRPAWTYEHQGVFDSHGIGWFNPVADKINGVTGGVTWGSIEDLTRKWYLEKTNDDGTVEVMFFGNTIEVDNASGSDKTYRVSREETQNVPISGVFVDGAAAGYTISGGKLVVNTTIPASGKREVKIVYGP